MEQNKEEHSEEKNIKRRIIDDSSQQSSKRGKVNANTVDIDNDMNNDVDNEDNDDDNYDIVEYNGAQGNNAAVVRALRDRDMMNLQKNIDELKRLSID